MIKEKLLTEDGYSLSMSWFHPKGNARGAVLIVPAMGVSKAFYAALGRWLAHKGFLAACFDFRGTGDSLDGDLRHVGGDVITWAGDAGAVLGKLMTEGKSLPISWIGRSLGGQILPLVPGHSQLQQVFTIATGNGYWLENSWSL